MQYVRHCQECADDEQGELCWYHRELEWMEQEDALDEMFAAARAQRDEEYEDYIVRLELVTRGQRHARTVRTVRFFDGGFFNVQQRRCHAPHE